MARSVWREDCAEYGVGGEWGGWVRMMVTSLSQLVDGGEGGVRPCLGVFISHDLHSSLLYTEVLDFLLFLFLLSTGMDITDMTSAGTK